MAKIEREKETNREREMRRWIGKDRKRQIEKESKREERKKMMNFRE